MAPTSCLAGIEPDAVALLVAVLGAAGAPLLPVVTGLDTAELGHLRPAVLLCDVDRLDVDPLERLRQLRFVLPACVIVVYTRDMALSWAIACHLAGANGLLAKRSSQTELADGLHAALTYGCFTDRRFAAAPALR